MSVEGSYIRQIKEHKAKIEEQKLQKKEAREKEIKPLKIKYLDFYEIIVQMDQLGESPDVIEARVKYLMQETPQKKVETKLRPCQRHKKRCREIAEKKWKEDPNITIADMVRNDEINSACEGRYYIKKTMRDWLKDLAPNRSPGRRPKKTG